MDIDVSKCELVDCWFYINHTPTKGEGDWCGAIHKGACKLNSTDCKDTPIERCLIKSLYEQLEQSKAEKEELKVRNSRGMLAFLEEDFKKEQKIKKYKQCLDEIEKIANDYSFPSYFDVYEEQDFYFNQLCKIDNILQKIKQAKEGIE